MEFDDCISMRVQKRTYIINEEHWYSTYVQYISIYAVCPRQVIGTKRHGRPMGGGGKSKNNTKVSHHLSPVFYLDVIYLVVVVRNIQMHLNTLESLLKLEPGLLTPQEFHTEFL